MCETCTDSADCHCQHCNEIREDDRVTFVTPDTAYQCPIHGITPEMRFTIGEEVTVYCVRCFRDALDKLGVTQMTPVVNKSSDYIADSFLLEEFYVKQLSKEDQDSLLRAVRAARNSPDWDSSYEAVWVSEYAQQILSNYEADYE